MNSIATVAPIPQLGAIADIYALGEKSGNALAPQPS